MIENRTPLSLEESTPSPDLNPSTHDEMLTWALAYAGAGLRVFPCHHVTRTETDDPLCSCGNKDDCKDKKNRGKHPRTKHGSKDATTDPGVIREWWIRWPDANIGIRTGDGLVVVDEDHGTHAFPPTLTQRTGRGRQFLYHCTDSSSVPGNIGVLPGVDLRSDGNYIIAPPSIHWSGRCYTWQRNGVDSDEVPDFKSEIATPGPEFWDQMLSGSFGTDRRGNGNHNGSAKGRKKKGFVVPDVIPDGQRDVTITALAGALLEKGLSTEAIEDACLRENEARCRPPLLPATVLKCVHSITNSKARGEMAVTLGLGDDALALKYVERYHQEVRYTAAWNIWHEYADGVWRADSTLHAFDRARLMLRELVVGFEPKDVEKYTSASTVSAVERLARSDRRLAAKVEQWDQEPWWLNTPGGVVDLRTGQLRPHRREDFLTKMCGAAPEGECPLWREFLRIVTKEDAAFESFLQRVAGYALTGVTSEQALFWLYGPGGNGKTTFLETLAGIMGDDYAKTASMDTFVVSRGDRHPTELAWLRGARLVMAMESAEGRRLDENRIKQLTGSDKITARGMRQDFFEYVPQFKLLFASNNKPHLGKVDEAYRRRINIVPFIVNIGKVKERDKDFAKKLKSEWGGILRWMIEGCLDWQRQGLNPPPIVSTATEEYLSEEDVRGRWIEERCALGPQLFTSTEMLWNSWNRWAELNNEFIGKRNDLLQYLVDERGLIREKRRGGGERHYAIVGIGLREESDWREELKNLPF